MEQLYNLIQNFKNGSKETFTLIMEKFEPKLNKLQRNSIYEDMKSDLVLFMLKLLNKIPLEKEIFKEDMYIVSYINKSLQNHYIYLNKINCKIMSKELVLEESYINNGNDNCFSNLIFEDIIKTLTDAEKDIIIKKYKHNYSEAEIARMKGISRQCIHKTHIRALSKMKKILG